MAEPKTKVNDASVADFLGASLAVEPEKEAGRPLEARGGFIRLNADFLGKILL